MRALFIARLRFISVVFFLVVLIIAGRLYVLQVIEGSAYSEKADRQYVAPGPGLFDRGIIYLTDKNGDLITGAGLASGFALAVNPTEVTDAEALFAALGAIVPLSRDEFMARATKANDPHEDVAHRLSSETAERIEKLSLPGVVLYRERWRHYPGGPLAAHTIGLLGYQGDELSGRYGLERYYGDVLGRDIGNLYRNFFAELFADVSDLLIEPSRAREGDIVTTIEPTVELALERTLRDAITAWDAKGGGGIIMDPRSGEIVALGAFPSFDPNNFSTADPSAFANPLVERVYEMGSIIKPLTVAAGIDSGAVKAATTYYDPGCQTLDTKTFCNFDGKSRGTVDMQEVLNQSLNTGAAFVMKRMGKERFGAYMRGYGLGEETGIDLPGEVAGLIKNLESPRDIEHATASFGQGIAMTPVATVRALASLANGGVLVTPHIVREIKHSAGFSRRIAQDQGERVLKQETAEEISRMLTRVVDEALLGGTVKLPRFSVAAKTGTAQIASPEGGYYDDRFLHAFFGYFPSYDARFIVFLYLMEPRGVKYSSQTLTEPFMGLTKFLINYYNIPPDR